MNDPRQLLNEYWAKCRALGVYLQLSDRLVALAIQCKPAFLTADLALEWFTQPRDAQPNLGSTAWSCYCSAVR